MPQLRGELAARAVPSPSSFRNAFSSRASGSPAWMASCCTAPAATSMCLETPRLHEGPRPGGVTAETNLRVALVMGQPWSRAAFPTHLLMRPAHGLALLRLSACPAQPHVQVPSCSAPFARERSRRAHRLTGTATKENHSPR